MVQTDLQNDCHVPKSTTCQPLSALEAVQFCQSQSLKADIIKQNNFNDEIEFTAKYYNEDTLNEMK